MCAGGGKPLLSMMKHASLKRVAGLITPLRPCRSGASPRDARRSVGSFSHARFSILPNPTTPERDAMRLEPVDIAIVGAGFGGRLCLAPVAATAGSAHPLCGARRLVRAALPALRSDWQRAAERGRLAQHQAQGRRCVHLRRLSDRRHAIRLQAADVERGRRLDHRLGRAFSEVAPLGFPHAKPRWRRRRLAFFLCRARIYYDLNDTECGVSRWRAIPPIRRRPSAPCRPSRSAYGHGRGAGFRCARLALVAGRRRRSIRDPMRAGPDATIAALPDRLRDRGKVLDQPHLSGRRRSRTASSFGRIASCSRSRSKRAGRAALLIATRTDAKSSSRAQIVVVAANGIGTRRLSGFRRRKPRARQNLMFHGAAYARGMFREELEDPSAPSAAPFTAMNSTRPMPAAASSAGCICK